MPERASAAQLTSLGKQTASGVAAVPDEILGAMGVSFQPQTETRVIRPSGAKYPTAVQLGREWNTLAVGGEASYPDLLYAFGSALGNGVLAAGTATFRTLPGATDVVYYFTVRKGDDTFGEQSIDCVFTELGFTFTREAVEVSGSMMGRAITTNVAKPGTMVAVPLLPIDPNDVCVYWSPDSTPGAPDKLLRVMQGAWNISGRQNPLWVLDCAQNSYVAVVEGATPEVTCAVTVEADAAGLGFITSLRNGSAGWLEFRANEAADTSFLSLMTHCQVGSIGELGDQDGVYAYEVSFQGTTDQTWGTVTEAKVKYPSAVMPAMAMVKESDAPEPTAFHLGEPEAEPKSKKAA